MSASTEYFDRIAQRILIAHANALPDLRGITVLLPDYHVAQTLAQALIVTLNEWAQSVVLDAPVVSDSQRGAL